ncbi:MAG: Ig-like domain-containing protein, partial [Pyrinomonadaceae bacterium]
MLSFTRRRLIVLSVFIALAIFAGFKFGPGSRAAKPKSLPMLGGPTIAATMTAAPTTDIGGNGAFVNPGDTLEYTVSINNTGQQANGVVFTDNLTDANLTLVPGSVKASPIAFDDTYPVTGNVRIQKAAGTLVSNDIRPTTGDNTGLTISAIGSDNTAPFSFTTANGGTVTATTGNGSFEYNPPPGFEGTAGSADTFTYTVTDPDGLTGTGTVRLDVSGMIWFINNGAPACTTLAAGCGRLTDPFSNLPAFTTINDGIGNNPAVNDNIFIFTGIGNYAAALTLLDGQKYIGQGASASIASITGLTLAADSDALPTTTPGANAVMIAGSGTSITLGVGNTIRGITVDNVGTGTKIFGSGFGTLTIGNNTTPDVTLSGTGKALDLTNGTFAATSAFSSVTTTSSPSHGMQLITVGGTVAFGSTSVSGSTAQGIFVNNSGVNLNFGNTTVGATGGATECIRLETNTGGTRTFGTIGVTNCTAQGITISGGGNVVATGQTTITNPGSTGLLLSSTTAGTSATFAGVNSTQSGGTGVQVSSSAGTVSFGDLDISPDSGQRALLADQNTGTISSTSGTIVATGNAGPFAISGPAGRTPLAMTLDSVNLTAPTNVGVNIALVSGNLTIGTTTIAGGAGNLVGLQVLSTAAGGTMNFGNTAVTGTNSVAGVRLGLAGQGNAGGVTFADLDIAPDSGHPALLITDGSGTTTSTSGAITATAAQAVNSSSSVLAMVLDSVTSTGGGITPGVNLTSSSGSIVMNGGTLTGNASGRTFLINSGTISSTYRGGITQAANSEMIEITGGHGTGTVTFNTG